MNRTIRFLVCPIFIAVASPVLAHDDHCGAVASSVADAGFADSVAVT